MPSSTSKDAVQPTDVLTLTSTTDIKMTVPPTQPRPTQAVLLCTYYITIPETGAPKASNDVKLLVGETKAMPQGEWKHTYNLSHTMTHQSDDMTSDGIVFPTAGLDGGVSLGEDVVVAAADLETVSKIFVTETGEDTDEGVSVKDKMPLRAREDGMADLSLD